MRFTTHPEEEPPMAPLTANAAGPRTPLSPPGEDPRWKKVIRTMRLNGFSATALIETLHTVQESFGYLEPEALRFVARSLRVPLSRVYAVATFYHFFTLKPPGRHTCVVCLGTACFIGGANAIMDGIQEALTIAPGETTADGNVSLLTARCLGACGLAPAAVFDGAVQGNLTLPVVLEKIKGWAKS